MDSKKKFYFKSSAALKVKELILEEGDPELKLRMYIIGGGCSGFKYAFVLDKEVKKDDFIFTTKDVDLIVDAISFQYLEEAELSYKQDLDGEHFAIKNPNSKTTCGCGSSFSI